MAEKSSGSGTLSAVLPHLEKRFDSQRVVFWQDTEGEYAAEVDALDLGDVTVLPVENNEYTIKNQVLQVDPDGKFLIYRQGPAPLATENWLLDLELAYGVFTADRTALVRQDLGIEGRDIDRVVAEHDRFFRAASRVNALKRLLLPGDDAVELRAKMSAVLLGQQDYKLLELTRALLVENAAGKDTKYQALTDFGLERFYWDGVARIYGYRAEEPSVDDFILWIFQKAIDGFESDTPGGLRNIQLDFDSLRNDRHSAASLAALANRAAEQLDYRASIEGASVQDLISIDLFEDVDQKIITELAQGVVTRTNSAREVADVVRKRQRSIWFDKYEQFYRAIDAAAELLGELAAFDPQIQSFDDGLEQYRDHWYRIDQLYRQFHRAARENEQTAVIKMLRDEVEKHYVNQYLYVLGAKWQSQVDEVDKWASLAIRSQDRFYDEYVEAITRKSNRKAVVIISDALRYEIADELRSLIRQEDRFDAELDATLGVLPSYTQLGMAALLPHKKLAHSDDGDPVLVDGQRSDGTINRNKILETVGGAAITAQDVLDMPNEELRRLYVDNKVLYVYHNRIDAIGDNAPTERQAFQAVDHALSDLVTLTKKLANANATNILITADHGFLYQDEPLEDASYLSTRPAGEELLVQNRRYVLGRGLAEDTAFRKFTPEQIGLDSDLEVLIPKSIHRLKRSGSGARFVHGGSSLQEIVVPVLSVNKKRKSDTRAVNVDVLPETDKITTGQMMVRLFQSEPVTEKIQPRTLRLGLYAGDTLISNQPEVTFDQPSSDQRDRYQDVQILLSQDANAFNNRHVELRLEEQIPNTSHWRDYRKVQYLLRRSFMSDFDF